MVQTAFYECIFIARQDISAQDIVKLTDKLIDKMKSLGGELIKKESWGLRPLGYIVKKNKKGHYIMLGVKASAKAKEEFERNCKIDEDIIKYLTVKVDTITQAPSQMMQAPAKTTLGANLTDDGLI